MTNRIITNNRKLTPIHPGRILQNKFLIPLKITQVRLAKDIKVSARKINEICQGKRSITVDTAARLAIYWPVSAQFWLGIQQQYDWEIFQGNTPK
ncbi:MAG: HigA family addiction module antidote protein [Candidatus Moeniiplasma glomeromycotorum]|nr:HigA family addiction module antidote protein [Candidatus Moeniiplasma glomeromycotorum]MCE8169476.1 HigA family addiction module antidote protein [Candidatus Moeniiplasma glomeromycotorum]